MGDGFIFLLSAFHMKYAETATIVTSDAVKKNPIRAVLIIITWQHKKERNKSQNFVGNSVFSLFKHTKNIFFKIEQEHLFQRWILANPNIEDDTKPFDQIEGEKHHDEMID